MPNGLEVCQLFLRANYTFSYGVLCSRSGRRADRQQRSRQPYISPCHPVLKSNLSAENIFALVLQPQKDDARLRLIVG